MENKTKRSGLPILLSIYDTKILPLFLIIKNKGKKK